MKISRPPFLSFVLPTYNVEEHIDRCLTSCTQQQHPGVEFIVVDDCGNDNSIRRAQGWTTRDSRIRIIRNNKNLGTFHARKAGALDAKGQYIFFLDPDDEITPSTATEIFYHSKYNKDLIFYKFKRVKKLRLRHKTFPSPGESNSSDELVNSIIAEPNFNLGTQGTVFKRSVLIDAFNSLNIRQDQRLFFGEDALLLFAALLIANNASSINKTLYIYHINNESITAKKDTASLLKQKEQIAYITNAMSQLYERTTPCYGNERKVELLKIFLEKYELYNLLISRLLANEQGDDQYFEAVLAAWSARHSFVDITRLAIYLMSFCTLKL